MQRGRRVDAAAGRELPSDLAGPGVQADHLVRIRPSNDDALTGNHRAGDRTFHKTVFAPVLGDDPRGLRAAQIDRPERVEFLWRRAPRAAAPPRIVAVHRPVEIRVFCRPIARGRGGRLERELDFAQFQVGNRAGRAFRREGGVAAEHRPADAVLGGHVDQTVGRHPAAVGAASGLGDLLGVDLAGRQVGQVELAREHVAAGHHRREAMCQAGRMSDEDLAASGIDRRNLDGKPPLVRVLAAVEQPEPIVGKHRARLAAVVHAGQEGVVELDLAVGGRKDVQGVLRPLVAERGDLERHQSAVVDCSRCFRQPGQVAPPPADAAALHVEHDRLDRFVAAGLALDERHRAVARHDVAGIGSWKRPLELARIGIEGPHRVAGDGDQDPLVEEHVARRAGIGILGQRLAGSAVQRDELLLLDGEQPAAAGNGRRAIGPQVPHREPPAGGRSQVVLPEAQAVESVAGEHARVEIASGGSDHAADLGLGASDPADPAGRGHEAVARGGVSRGRVPRVRPLVHLAGPRLPSHEPLAAVAHLPDSRKAQ